MKLQVAGWCIAVALTVPVSLPARSDIPVVGFLWMGAPPPQDAPNPVHATLRQLGQEEGRTFVWESRFASGDNARFPVLARELLEHRPAVIVTVCGPALRAIRALNANVPVIAGCADARNFLGEVNTLAHPGGRTTGFTFLAPESATKRMQLLKELLPNISRVAVLHNRQDDWGSYWQETERAAKQLRVRLSRFTYERPDQLEDAVVAAVRDRADALVVLPDATTVHSSKQLAALALRYKLPTIFDNRMFVEDGGLISYGPDWMAIAPSVIATYVDKILRGESVGELPVQQPTRLELVVNAKTARALGVRVPGSILNAADTVIR